VGERGKERRRRRRAREGERRQGGGGEGRRAERLATREARREFCASCWMDGVSASDALRGENGEGRVKRSKPA